MFESVENEEVMQMLCDAYFSSFSEADHRLKMLRFFFVGFTMKKIFSPINTV